MAHDEGKAETAPPCWKGREEEMAKHTEGEKVGQAVKARAGVEEGQEKSRERKREKEKK